MTNKKPVAAGKSSFDLIDAEILFSALPLAKDSVILDAACGFGAYTLAIAPLCPQGTVFALASGKKGSHVCASP